MRSLAVVKMSLVNISGPLDKFDDIIRECIVDQEFCPENIRGTMPKNSKLVPFNTTNPNTMLLGRILKLAEKLQYELDFCEPSHSLIGADEASLYLDDLEREYDSLSSTEQDLRLRLDEDAQILLQLDKIKDVDWHLDSLFNLRFTKMHFGRLPKDVYTSFIKSLESDPQMYFFPAGQTPEYVYGLYMCPHSNAHKAEIKLSSLNFEKIYISGRAHGTPHDALLSIQEEQHSLEINLEEVLSKKTSLLETEHLKFLSLYSSIKFLNDTYDMRSYAAHMENNFYMCGWVSTHSLESFLKSFEPFSDCVLITEESEPSNNLIPPTKLANKGVVKVFEQFVTMYGLPNYNELDPTSLLALSYTLFFGAMFGDVGQGALLIIGGLLAGKYLKMALGKVIAVVGISSVAFGFLYGSVFGNENILPGFKAFESSGNTNIILISAIGLGLIFISIAIIFNVINGIKQKNLGKALFSQNGLAGFVMYWAIIIGVLCSLVFNVKLFNPVYISLLIVLPLILIFLQHPLSRLVAKKAKWWPKKFGEYAVENTFELFEILLSLLSNTISFVRIGAFALNHVGMMLVVFALAKSVSSATSPVVHVFGNVFVMFLEGLIVGIQVLRLEFYELFGRFYSGNGREYTPFKIEYKRKRDKVS